MALPQQQFEALKNTLKQRKEGLSEEGFNQLRTVLREKKTVDFTRKKPEGFVGKARDVAVDIVGGGKLAEGAGLGLAAPFVQKTLDKERRETEALQEKLLARIREKKAAGEDTARLEKAFRDSQGLVATLGDVQQDFVGALPTTKEVIGSSLRLATTVGAGAITKVAAKATALGKSAGFTQGAIRGAAAGATSGGVIGGATGIGLGLEANKSSIEVLESGALGLAGGVVTGGILGGLTGGVSGAVTQRKITKENFVKELVSPKQTPKMKAEAIKQGRLKDPTLLNKAEIDFSRRDQAIAKSLDGVVSPKATISQNIDSIRTKINQMNEGIKNFIVANKVPFNTRQLRARLMTGKDDLRLIFASDRTAERTYNAVVDAFMEHVSKKDTAGLFSARQAFDKIPAIKKLLNTAGLGENARKEIVLSARRAANEYIASLLPKGNKFRETLLNESHMIEGLGNLADKSVSIVGKNRIQILADEYPILKWVVGGFATGAAGAAGVGVGGAIIGSTE